MASVEARVRDLKALRLTDMFMPLLIEDLGEGYSGEEEADEIPPINIDVHLEVADLLLKAGADPRVIDQDDFTPLMTAAIANDIEMAKLLVAYNADPSYINYLDYTAALYASDNGDKDMVQLIQKALDAMQK